MQGYAISRRENVGVDKKRGHINFAEIFGDFGAKMTPPPKKKRSSGAPKGSASIAPSLSLSPVSLFILIIVS